MLDELHSLVTSKRGHLLSLGLARLRTLRARPADDRPVGDRRRAGRAAPLAGRSQNSARARHVPSLITVPAAPSPTSSILDSEERVPWAGHSVALRHPGDLRGDQRAPDDAAVRQHAQPGGDAVPGAVADQRGQPADRAASRLARRRPAPARREGDGEQQPARHRRHLDARSRHRLGRRRSRRPCRRAEGRQPAGAAHRPLQPPHGRAEPRDPGAVQPLRGAGVPRRARRQLSRRAGHAAAARRRARRAGAACARHAPAPRRSMPTSSIDEVRSAAPYARLDRARPSTASSISSRPAAMRCGPTSATPASARPRRASGASPIRASPSNTG